MSQDRAGPPDQTQVQIHCSKVLSNWEVTRIHFIFNSLRIKEESGRGAFDDLQIPTSQVKVTIWSMNTGEGGINTFICQIYRRSLYFAYHAPPRVENYGATTIVHHFSSQTGKELKTTPIKRKHKWEQSELLFTCRLWGTCWHETCEMYGSKKKERMCILAVKIFIVN